VRSVVSNRLKGVAVCAAVLWAGCVQASGLAVPGGLAVPDALAGTLRGTQASAVVLDYKTGTVVAVYGAERRGAPGSAIKPMLLEYALEHGIVRPETEVYCRRDLRVGGQALPCTHPVDQPVFDAERALAESCNTWFAAMGRRYLGDALEAALRETHLPHTSMGTADVAQREFAVLGLRGVTASPMELARAFRELLLRMHADGTVARGLRGSVNYGMADQAAVKGIDILGKTGTASDLGEAWTHGWFEGAIAGRLVIVVYVPHGDGGTAALLAQKFFRSVAAE
jgi:cell division protein FtsI/penicillin-binding protein 2